MNKIKLALVEKCNNFVEDRLDTINKIISSNRNALLSETKSSAGDKHETARSLLQLELEKASLQLPSVNKMKEILGRINFQSKHETIHLGSIIITNQRNYFLAISVGNLEIKNKDYFVISPSSPMGSFLLGKKEGDQILFNNYKIQILAVH